jgi:hypothetical protein
MSTKLTSRSVTLSRENYDRLRKFGYADQTLDNVIGHMIDVVEQVTREEEER